MSNLFISVGHCNARYQRPGFILQFNDKGERDSKGVISIVTSFACVNIPLTHLQKKAHFMAVRSITQGRKVERDEKVKGANVSDHRKH